MTMERQSRIELLLCEEFEAEGHKVQKLDGAFVAFIKTTVNDGTVDYIHVDLTRLAELIDRRM